jgi:hypothetical protein
MLTARLLFSALLVVALAPAARAQDERAAVSHPHHQGFEGQPSPHNGWAAYGRLTLDIGGDRYFVYDQARGEFSATVVERGSDVIKIRGVNIPGAGLFYYPAEASPCQPDAMERLGLYAELVLFYLSKAFPAGPKTAAAASSAPIVVDSRVPELHFMQGMMKPRDGVPTLVSVSGNAREMEYLLHDDKDNVRGKWTAADNRPPVIPDREPLREWQTCWMGTWASLEHGGSRFTPRLRDASSLKTFADVRKALRAQPLPQAKPKSKGK